MTKRKQIRDAIKNILNGDDLIVGERIYCNRYPKIEDENETLHGLMVITLNGESASIFNRSPKITKRVLKLSLVVILAQEDSSEISSEDKLEDISQRIEEKLIRWELSPLKGLISMIDYEGYDFTTNEDAQFMECAIKLDYSITYYVEEVLDIDELDDFERSNVQLKRGVHNDFEFTTEQRESM